MKDIAVRMKNRPGTLSAAATALHKAGITVSGVCGFAIDGRGLRHLLVGDGEYRNTLLQAGAELVEEHDVVVVRLDPRPDWLGSLTARLGEAGVNIEVIYMAINNQLAIVPSDLTTARSVLSR